MLQVHDCVGITACSDALPLSERDKLAQLADTLRDIGLCPVFSPCIFSSGSVFNGTACERAGALMRFYLDSSIRAIFDVSGGNLSNQLIDRLDFDAIRQNAKPFWGYSDVSALINAIYTKTGNPACLYQVKNLVGSDGKEQVRRFTASVMEGRDELFKADWHFIRGSCIEGIVAGGNLRCFLKLAGTPYFPDLRGKVLFLESLRGTQAQTATYLCQLREMGVFRCISGLLVGTFTKLEEAGTKPDVEELLLDIVDDPSLPIAKTPDIGHAESSRGIVIGGKIIAQ